MSGSTLDPRAVGASFGAASRSYDAASWIQTTARNELLTRLPLLAAPPAAVLDVAAATGFAAAAIKRRFRRATVVAMDIAAPMLEQVARHSRFWRPIRRVRADARGLPFADASFDLVFCNLLLHWLLPPDAALAEMRRVLKPGGLLLASALGPETLQELRAAWAAVDDGVHVNGFLDVHDLGGALQRAGFTEPVLDVDRLQRHYPDASTLMRELKAYGGRNVDSRRARGLTGRGAFARLGAAYEAQRVPAGLPSTWQVVYAVAWTPEDGSPRFRAHDRGEARIGLDELRASLSKRRR